MDYMRRFREELVRLLKERGLTQRGFAQDHLGYTSHATVGQVIQGRTGVPLDDLDRWLDALGLEGRERQTMWRMAMEEYAPPYVLRLMHKVDVLEEQLAEITRLAVKAGVYQEDE
jgi:transcriptional regulator with XRE-family HTH domain